MNWKSTPNFGHTFKEHGKGDKITKSLIDRANNPTMSPTQGQWLDNQKAADFLNSLGKIDFSEPPKEFPIPEGLGQVVHKDGSVTKATKVRVVINKKTGKIRSAFPVE